MITVRSRLTVWLCVAFVMGGCSGTQRPVDDSGGINERPNMGAIPQTAYVVGQETDVVITAYDKEDSAKLRFEIESSTVPDIQSRSELVPQGVRDNIASAVFRWTPQTSDIGSHQIKFRVWDPHGNSSAERLYLTVVAK